MGREPAAAAAAAATRKFGPATDTILTLVEGRGEQMAAPRVLEVAAPLSERPTLSIKMRRENGPSHCMGPTLAKPAAHSWPA